MMPLVRMGDPLRPYGGEVLEGHFEALGMPVACMGDNTTTSTRKSAGNFSPGQASAATRAPA